MGRVGVEEEEEGGRDREGAGPGLGLCSAPWGPRAMS